MQQNADMRLCWFLQAKGLYKGLYAALEPFGMTFFLKQ